MADINVTINIDAGKEVPKVEVKKNNTILKKPKVRIVTPRTARKSAGGVLQFPSMPVNNNPVLDLLGIRET